ncbi:MAG: cation:proton antiporter [Acidobacteria bacterium]|nr:MAG: cation:proton antiporter [Acidobacteriota bacterium]
MPSEFWYVALLFTLFVVPRMLQRFRVPSAVTALAFGIAAGPGAGLLTHDDTVALLSTLGIVSLFLFAGLDVSVSELRQERRVLVEHIAVRLLMLGTVTAIVTYAAGLPVRPAVLSALALLTPSTGFILDSLERWLPDDRDRFWVRSKAIATEIVALLVLFVALQSTSAARLGWSSAALIGLIAVLPLLFRWFAAFVVPHAPRSEFGFLVMVAVAAALITRHLGVYYLVGAFAVGMAARQFRTQLPGLSSDRMVGAVESFASLFVPFYFFRAGASLSRTDFSLAAAGYGLLFIIMALPFRLCLVAAHRAARLDEPPSQGLRIAMAMMPTTVFTLVLAEILRVGFRTPDGWIGGLVIYAIVNSLLPGLVLRITPPAFEDELQLEESGRVRGAVGQ